MRDIARQTEKNRAELFSSTAAKMGIPPAIIEKDFWVCLLLDYLFSRSEWKTKLVFKGGTSLSKAYDLIQRFSEDIDLIIDWTLLGYNPEEPWDARTNSKQDQFNKDMNERAIRFIEEEFVPGVKAGLCDWLKMEIDISVDGQNVQFTYPRSFSLNTIRPQVLLEIGPLARWVPNKIMSIRPYAAEFYPSRFTISSSEIRTVVAERTFWEKATILHQEAHRQQDKRLPSRYSRHYYDLYRMIRSPIRDLALASPQLLRDVVEFKNRFYRCPWARYDEALEGSLRLMPPECHLNELRKDYASMQGMLFGEIPELDTILSTLRIFEYDAKTMEHLHLD